jgi:hypothetical protein
VVVTTDELLESRLQRLAVPGLPGGGQSTGLEFVRAPDESVMLYKRYTAESLLPESRERLRTLVRWRRELNDVDRRELDARMAWVRHIVTDGRNVTGVLITPATDGFWTWKDGKPVPRKIDSIGVAEERARKRGEDYANVPHTVATLGHLLTTLNLLHRRGVVVGDVNRANVLVASPVTAPRTYLLDCDSVLLHGRRSLRAAEAEAFRPDDISAWPEELNRRTDLYKFALMCVGAVAKDMSLLSVTPDVARHLPPSHDALLRRLLVMGQNAPAVEFLDAVARLWRDYCPLDGAQYVYEPGNLKRLPWTGAASFEHGAGPGRSPVSHLASLRRRSGPWAAGPAVPPQRRQPPVSAPHGPLKPTTPPPTPRSAPPAWRPAARRTPPPPPSIDWASTLVRGIFVVLLIVLVVSMYVMWAS